MLRTSHLVINNKLFQWGSRTYLMGVLNITADSFSGDGLRAQVSTHNSSEENLLMGVVNLAVELGKRFVKAGVDILDVGGESTRPGSQPVGLEEELSYVIPVVSALAAELDVLISIDTYKAQVAETALHAGAHLVNDIWGFHADPEMASVVARWNVPVILMHNRSSWVHAEIKERLGGRYIGIAYENLLEDIKKELLESVALAHEAGISDEKIILDPGIGFGKTVEQNLELLDRLGEIRDLGYPLLFGPSRKSFIGYTLDAPPEQRLEGTAAAVAVGITRGADLVRVHDVEFMARVVRMTDAIVRRGAQS